MTPAKQSLCDSDPQGQFVANLLFAIYQPLPLSICPCRLLYKLYIVTAMDGVPLEAHSSKKCFVELYALK